LIQASANGNLVQQVAHEKQNLQQQRQEHNRLVQATQHYKDPAVIENEARQQLGYVRPGEHAVVVIGAGDQGQQKAQNRASVPVQQGFWQEWWHTFFED
jgi:hypothetical protein